jgi:hypothetical protein
MHVHMLKIFPALSRAAMYSMYNLLVTIYLSAGAQQHHLLVCG